MLSFSNIFSNGFLSNTIIQFLSVKEIINLSSVNKKFSSLTNQRWNKLCNEYYSSPYDEYGILDDSELNDQMFLKEENIVSKISWKQIFKDGQQLHYLWKNVHLQGVKQFHFDCVKSFELIKEFLKEPITNLSLKVNHRFLQSHLNTEHQKFLYEFVYESRDVYCYYQKEFDKKSEKIIIKNRDLPFSSVLENYFNIAGLETDDITILQNLRFYHLDLPNWDFLNLNYKSVCDFCLNFDCVFNEVVSIFISGCFSGRNSIIKVLILLYLTFSFFCVLSFCDIIQNQESGYFSYMNTVIKRYKAYEESAQNINKNFENFNVIINMLYERICASGEHIYPRFSIYRMMMIIYKRLVISPLLDQSEHKNLINIYGEVYSNYFKEKMRKVNENELMIIEDCGNTNDTDSGIEEGYGMKSTLKGIIDKIDNVKGLNLEENEWEISQFIQEIPLLLLDFSCNEYSVFYINSSQFPIEGSYKVINDKMIDLMRGILKQNYCHNSIDLIELFMENEIINEKIINATKIMMINEICDFFISEEVKGVKRDLEEYLSNCNSEEDLNFDNNSDVVMDYEVNSFLRDNLIAHISLVLKDLTYEQCKNKLFEFLEGYSQNDNFQTISKAYKWKTESNLNQNEINNKVSEETMKKNILLTKKIYNSLTWNFEMDIHPKLFAF